MKIESLSKKKPSFDVLKKNKVPLTEEERGEVFKEGATWSYGSSKDPNTCKKVNKVSAIWKSVVDGETYYGCNTHRAWDVRKSLSAAINLYHNVIEPTS